MATIRCQYYALMASFVLLTGCTSSAQIQQNSQFHSRITETNLKHFEVSLYAPLNEQLTEIDNNARQQQKRRAKPARLKRMLDNVAKTHIEQNGFCRTGYWVLDTNLYSSRPTLRGECNESATIDDRSKFPDTIKQW